MENSKTKVIMLLFFCSMFALFSCNKDNEYTPNEEIVERFLVKIPEMIRFPEIEELDVNMKLINSQGEAINYTKTLNKTDGTTFSTQNIELSNNSYTIENVEIIATDQPVIQSQFEEIAYSLEAQKNEDEKFTFVINKHNRAFSLKLWSITYASPLSKSKALKTTSEEEETSCAFYLFINRCNPEGPAETYHEVLEYQITFDTKAMQQLTGSTSKTDFNYENNSIENPSELVIVSDFLGTLKTLPITIGEGETQQIYEEIPITIHPKGSDELIEASINQDQWNDHITGKTRFIHLQIACEKP